METFIVDRLENDLVILERDNKTFLQVPLTAFVSPVSEGSVVLVGADGKYSVDEVKTAARKAKLFQLQKNIFSD
ncbi:MAG: DUF3006 domain-containing protein [Clostridia bacterium]|nr:DUF3006 domain-containing protein [Clostridia bacterium]